MRVVVDEDRCRGHAACCASCPEVFALTDDGYAVAQRSEVPVQFEQAVRDASRNCPERAIVVG
jgi:ferredoxin